MPNTAILNQGDKFSERYAQLLEGVLRDLDGRLVEIINSAQTSRDVFEAAVILNSRPEMVQALIDSGYVELSSQFIGKYPDMVTTVLNSVEAAGLPRPEFTAVDRDTFRQLAAADLSQFEFIGTAALDELRFGLHRQAITGQPFSALVDAVRAATVGVDGKGSPLRNHAYTHANTAVLSFGGEVLKEAGEALGAERWEVVGPKDAVTRPECREALANPIRTEEEWKQHQGADGQPYWGGTPGGWNCRHQLFPVLE